VHLFAGKAMAGSTSPQGTGGYRDGAVDVALFNRPSGVAVAKDGTVYIADSLNRLIRKIRDGTVSTLAGSGVASGTRDGVGTAATFSQPRSIATDDAGNIYVADYGAGIRKITPTGSVSTLDLPNDKNVCGVAARGSGTGLLLAYTEVDPVSRTA